MTLLLLYIGAFLFTISLACYVGSDDQDDVASFKTQLIQNAQAALDAALRTNLIDERRVAIAEHSGGGDAPWNTV